MARIIVTGTRGYLGGKIAAFLREAGHEPACIAGRRDFQAQLDKAAAAGAPEIVVHAGFNVDYRSADAVDPEAENIASTRHVIELCQATGSRLVFLSAAAVLGVSATPRVRNEADRSTCDPGFEPYMRTRYVREKLHCERMIDRADLPGTAVLYLTTTYGPGMQEMVKAKLRGLARGPVPVVPCPPGGTSFLHLSDLLQAMRLFIDDKLSGNFVVSSGNASFSDLFRTVLRQAGTSWRKQVIPVPARALPEQLLQRDPVLLSSLGFKYYSPGKLMQAGQWRPRGRLAGCAAAILEG